MKPTIFLVLLLSIFLQACASDSLPPGRIRIRNDLRGEKYSTLVVSGGGTSYTLRAGERALMPPGTTMLSFSYRDEKSDRFYQVQCPRITGEGININLIDVHVNRISGGCQTMGFQKK